MILSALAVLRLTRDSNFVGYDSGKPYNFNVTGTLPAFFRQA